MPTTCVPIDNEQMQSLLNQHGGLLGHVVQRYRPLCLARRIDLGDIEQAARVALWKAAATFDSDKGVKFSTWFTWMAREQVGRMVAKQPLWKTWATREDEDSGAWELAGTHQNIDRLEIEELTSRALAVLTSRESVIVASFFGLGQTRQTLEEIGQQLGVSRQRVDYLLQQSLKKMRTALKVETV